LPTKSWQLEDDLVLMTIVALIPAPTAITDKIAAFSPSSFMRFY